MVHEDVRQTVTNERCSPAMFRSNAMSLQCHPKLIEQDLAMLSPDVILCYIKSVTVVLQI